MNSKTPQTPLAPSLGHARQHGSQDPKNGASIAAETRGLPASRSPPIAGPLRPPSPPRHDRRTWHGKTWARAGRRGKR
eukprot:8791512-Lingulodinium_polyedra.AAC.1